MATLVNSLLRCLATHFVLFAIISTLVFLVFSFSHIWQGEKAPPSLLEEIKAPNVETATAADIDNYLHLLDERMLTYTTALSSIKDPVQRAPLEKRMQKLSNEWCKFMRIQTGRNYKTWRFNYNWVGQDIENKAK